MKGQRGVTLVALVITVIVMLILAGVAISALTQNDGLFQKKHQKQQIFQDIIRHHRMKRTKMDHLEDYIDEKFRQLNITVD